MAYDGTLVAGGEGNTTFNASGEFLGRDLEFLNQTFPSAVNGKTAKDSTVDVVEKTPTKIIKKYKPHILKKNYGAFVDNGNDKWDYIDG